MLLYPRALERMHGKQVTFSTTCPDADYYCSIAEGMFRIDERGVRAWECPLPFKEHHFLHNLAAALATARQMGVKWDVLETRISDLSLPKMRFEQFEREGVWIINDAYNANPASMRAALENLPEPKEGGKRIAVLGSMKELGRYSQEAHREIGCLAQKKIDHLLCIGDETLDLVDAFAGSKKPVESCRDVAHAADLLKGLMRSGDVVLIKGSRSLQLERILERLNAFVSY